MKKYECQGCNSPCYLQTKSTAYKPDTCAFDSGDVNWVEDKPIPSHEDINFISNLTGEILRKLEIVKEAVEKLEDE